MDSVLACISNDGKKEATQESYPSWINPMLAKLTHDYFSDEKWIFERKLDGERCLAFKHGAEIRLMTRNKKKINGTYPELVKAIANQKISNVILDGEIVAFEGECTSFSKLQERMHVKNAKEAQKTIDVFYYLFDILYVEKYNVTKIPLIERKSLLNAAVEFHGPLRFTAYREKEGEAYYEEACEKGWEGIIAKRKDSAYLHTRSKKWLKFKCVNQQEFVIGGYTEPHGSRVGFGALLLGYYNEDRFVYAGKVGTGFNDETLRHLSKKLASLETDTPPFTDEDLPHKEVHWVDPVLVCEIGFTEWTDYGKLRHPRYLGLRRDKNAQEVVREEPEGFHG